MSGPFPDTPSQHAPQLPVADVCRFLPELTTELATAQTTQNEEVEQKQSQLLHLQVIYPNPRLNIHFSYRIFFICNSLSKN